MNYSCLAQAIIPITQGSDYQDTVQINQVNGAPADLTGYIVRSQLRRANGELAATFTCSVPAPASGAISRTLTAVQTAALVPSATISYAWGVELVNGSGKVMEIQGGARVVAEVVK